MQDVGHIMLHLHVAHLPPITLSSWTSDLFPTNDDKDAELKQQFPSSINLKQYCQTYSRTKAKKPDIKFSQYA